MKRVDKKIIYNENLEQPRAESLDAAKSYLQENTEHRKTRFSRKTIASFATMGALLLVLVICIPLMLPAFQSDEFFIYTADLTVEEINSVADYNTSELLSFAESPTSCRVYYHNIQAVFVKEIRTIDGFTVTYLIKLKTTLDERYVYELEDDFYLLKNGNVSNKTINGMNIEYIAANDSILIGIDYEGNSYYIKADDTSESADWERIIEKLLT